MRKLLALMEKWGPVSITICSSSLCNAVFFFLTIIYALAKRFKIAKQYVQFDVYGNV